MITGIPNEIAESTETLTTIYERRAVRKYKDNPVSRELIEDILDAGRMAPSAINRQPWRFYVLTNKATIHSFSREITKVTAKEFVKSGPKQVIKTLANLLHFSHGLELLKNEDPIFHGAPVVIFITAPKDNEWAPLDIGMCAQNIMLAAKAMGLDSCPVGMAKYAAQTKNYLQLQIPSTEQICLAVVVGYGDEMPEVHKRIKDNILFVD